MFPFIPDFRRGREGVPPNNLLNYGYAILRAIVKRSLVGSGLLLLVFIITTDTMPIVWPTTLVSLYRPFVDKSVVELVQEEMESGNNPDKIELN